MLSGFAGSRNEWMDNHWRQGNRTKTAKTMEFILELACRVVPIAKRIQRFYATVRKTVLWGSGGWTLTQVQACRVKVFENMCLRRIVGRRRKPHETFVQHLRFSTRLARGLARALGLPSLVEQIGTSIRRWVGHIARLPQSYPIARALKWRSVPWWRTMQKVLGQLDPTNLVGWPHPASRNRVPKLELLL